MTVGKNSRGNSTRSSVRAPKFLDKSSGFYGRLDEPETSTDGGCSIVEKVEIEIKDGCSTFAEERNTLADEDVEVFAMIEDDGETLLRRKPNRLSSRWRRSSRRKQKGERVEEEEAQDEKASKDKDKMKLEREEETVKEPGLVHIKVREFADVRVLIQDNKRGREENEEETEEERKMKKEQEEGIKMVKKTAVKNYWKAFDRALRRGWEAFITNLYSVTLMPVKSSEPLSTPLSLKQNLHNSVLAEFQ